MNHHANLRFPVTIRNSSLKSLPTFRNISRSQHQLILSSRTSISILSLPIILTISSHLHLQLCHNRFTTIENKCPWSGYYKNHIKNTTAIVNHLPSLQMPVTNRMSNPKSLPTFRKSIISNIHHQLPLLSSRTSTSIAIIFWHLYFQSSHNRITIIKYSRPWCDTIKNAIISKITY